MYISITTDGYYGAIKATLEHDAGVTFDFTNSTFDKEEIEDYMYSIGTNSITFAVLTKNLTTTPLGSNSWVELCFDLNGLSNATFNLTDISVVSVDDVMNTNTIADIESTIVASNTMCSLGAQYRVASDGIPAAIRFGTKLFREEGTNAVEGGTAVSCGYILGYTETLEEADATLGATLKGKNLILNDENAMINVRAEKYLKSEADYMIYTVAVYFEDENSPKKAKEIQVKPYVIYKDASGYYHIEWGSIMKNSFNNILTTYNALS